LRRRPFRERDACSADAEGEERGGVTRISEKELRHWQDDVVLAIADDVDGEAFVGDEWIVREMHDGLRRARRPGRELPESHAVAARRERIELVVGGVDGVFERAADLEHVRWEAQPPRRLGDRIPR